MYRIQLWCSYVLHCASPVTMVKTSKVLGAVALLPTLASAYALPEACSGVCNNSHDPSIIRRADGTYFRFSTGGRIAIHTAPSLTGPWTYVGAALPSGSSINLAGNQDLWVSRGDSPRKGAGTCSRC
jgi:arabinan endo-1,5-alpha-L-arabinosidase